MIHLVVVPGTEPLLPNQVGFVQRMWMAVDLVPQKEVVVLDVMPVALVRPVADAVCALAVTECIQIRLQPCLCHLFQVFVFLLRFHMFKSLAVGRGKVQRTCHTTASECSHVLLGVLESLDEGAGVLPDGCS